MSFLMRSVVALAVLLVLLACEAPESLKPVAGLEGELVFSGLWPDSIQAAALVVLDPLAALDQANIGKYLLSFTNPVVENSEYFVQLESGTYLGVVVGLTVDPGLFAANIDDYLDEPELPLVILTDVLQQGVFLIREGEITLLDWQIDYN